MKQSLARWDVYWVDFPYEDQPGQDKRRPAIIAKDNEVYVLTLKVTSRDARDYDPGDYALRYWKEAGLSAESVVRVRKIAKLSRSDIHERIGRIQTADALAIQRIMAEIKHARDEQRTNRQA